MKKSTFTLLLAFFILTISNANDTNFYDPWEIENISVGDIIELEDINFEMDQSDLVGDSQKSLKVLANFLMENKTVSLELRGHTNSTPDHVYCDELSNNRAHAVRDYLISEGVNPDKLVAKGYGKRVPKNSNHTSEGRVSNQRVDIKILSK